MVLFGPKERTDIGYKTAEETEFRYLNRSARDYSVRARNVLNSWFPHVAEGDQERMRRDLSSRSAVSYASTLFELGLHEIGRRLGCKAETHPEMPGTLSRPDFRFRCEDGTSFLVEAKDFTGISEQARKAEVQRQKAYSALNTIPAPDFSLLLSLRGAPNQSVPCARLKTEVREWLATLDYEKALAMKDADQLDELPSYEWNWGGWRVDFRARPRSRQFRGQAGRTIGTIANAALPTGPVPILEALDDKAKKYRVPTEPYIIALNVTDHFADESDLEGALFGIPGLRAHCGPEDERLNFQTKGLWLGRTRWRNTQVSGVLLFGNFIIWNAASARVILCINPAADRPIVGPFTTLARRVVEGIGLRDIKGITLEKLLELPSDWPYSG